MRLFDQGFRADLAPRRRCRRLSAGGSAEKAADGTVDESQIQDLVLDIAQVAGNNGLKLPREFGLLIKQAAAAIRHHL